MLCQVLEKTHDVLPKALGLLPPRLGHVCGLISQVVADDRER
jgi:hypothetical protein